MSSPSASRSSPMRQRRQEPEHVAEGAAGQGHQPLRRAGAVHGAGERRRPAYGPGPSLTSSTASMAPRPRTSPTTVGLALGERASRGQEERPRSPGRGPRRSSASIVSMAAERSGAGDRVAAVGAAEAADVDGVHHLRAAGDGRQRQPAGHALGGGDQVRDDALVVAGEPVAGAAKPVWISSAMSRMPCSRHQSATRAQPPRRRDDEAALALDRLDEHRGAVRPRRPGCARCRRRRRRPRPRTPPAPPGQR